MENESEKCPICNSRMILRNGSRGKFWGCSRYPSCKGTKRYTYEKIINDYKPLEIIPSKYQQDIKEFFLNDLENNLVIEATAGSGKSSTCRWLLQFTENNQEIAFISFNKEIADDNAKKCPPHIEVSTSHSLGLRNIKQAWGYKLRVNQNKIKDILKMFLEENEADEDTIDDFKSNINNTCRIVSLFKNTLLEMNEENFQYICDKYGILLNGDSELVYQMTQLSLEQSNEDHNTLDFDDMIFFCVSENINCRKFDILLVDEAQDLNNMQMKFIQKSIKPSGRIICVGDRFQSIYGFRGADTNAIPNLINILNAKTLPLSISYRCPKVNIALINEKFPSIRIEAKENAIEGEMININIDKMSDTIKEGDLAICRNNAPLIRPCFSLIRKGIKAMIKGKEIGVNLSNIIFKAMSVKKNNISDVRSLLMYLEDYRMKECDKASSLNNLGKVEYINDQIDTIEILCEGEDTIEEVLNKIDNIFKKDNEGIVFSTIHKAKGLEADNVYLIQPELIPSSKAIKPEDIQQENNIFFVAYTRNMKKMYLVAKA